MSSIPFKIIKEKQVYESRVEGLDLVEKPTNIIIRICRKFPTPGYSLKVSKIVEHMDIYNIHLLVVPPETEAILPQVICYKSVTLEIKKEDLKAEPYRFQLIDKGLGGNFERGTGRLLY